jgi:hypothetical protein
MNERDVWKDAEKGKEEDYFMKKHREWLEKKKQKKGEPGGGSQRQTKKKSPVRNARSHFQKKTYSGWTFSTAAYAVADGWIRRA